MQTIETAWITLRDGCRLAASIWLPDDTEQAPAVLEFLPYRRRDGTAARDQSNYPFFAEAGIAGVRVDLRGTGDSDGIYDDEYSERELSDAEEVIAWIADQTWCNGNVGMMGISWGGFNALQVAARKPPALKAVISIASTVDRFADDIHYKGGCQLSAQLYWSNIMLGYIARPPDSAVVGARWLTMWQDRLDMIEPSITEWLNHQRRDDYWRHGSISEDFAGFNVPAMVIAGWADGYRNTPWNALNEIADHVWAITGPWIHKYPHFAWPRPRIDFHREAIRFWNHWLKDEQTDLLQTPRNRLYLSSKVRPAAKRSDEPGRWVSVDHKAPACSHILYPTPNNRLDGNTPGDGRITISSPVSTGAQSGEYFTLNVEADLPGDQTADDAGSMLFATATLDRPVDLTGRPVLQARLKTNQPVCTLVARLIDQHPDGVTHRVSLGILNLAHRNGSSDPLAMTTGKFVDITLALDVTGYRFETGHKIRLALSTHYFPMILPAPADPVIEIKSGANTHLTLPVLPIDEIEMPEPSDPALFPQFPQRTEPSARRTVTRDDEGGTSTTNIIDDTGMIEIPDHGMLSQERRQSIWSVRDGDPLSARGHETLTVTRIRDGIETCSTAEHWLEADADHWRVRARLISTMNDETVFSREWSSQIPRDLN